MGKYLQQADLEASVSKRTVAQLCDDDGDGVADPIVIAAIIENGEAELDSRLPGFYGVPLTSPSPPVINATGKQNIDRLIKIAALDFSLYYLFRRHPEYVKTFGEDGRTIRAWAHAEKRVENIQRGVQQLMDTETVEQPQNMGGVFYDGSNRMIIDGADGTSNNPLL